MRKLEEKGKQFKRTGYFQGTAMWKWRNYIAGGIILTVGVIDFGWLYYWYRNRDKTRQEREERQNRYDPVKEKRAELEKRKLELNQKEDQSAPDLKKVFANFPK